MYPSQKHEDEIDNVVRRELPTKLGTQPEPIP